MGQAAIVTNRPVLSTQRVIDSHILFYSLLRIIDPDLKMAEALLQEVVGRPRLLLARHTAELLLGRAGGLAGLGPEVLVVDGRLGLVAGGPLPTVVDALLLDDLVGEAAVVLALGQHVPDLLLGEAHHQALVLPPEAIVRLVPEDGQLRHLLPTEPVVLRDLQQLLLQLEAPHVLPDGGVDEVAVPLPHLQLVLDLHFGGDDAPAPAAKVLEQDDQHQRLVRGPPPSGKVGLHPVVVLVVDLIGEAVFEELVDLLPVIPVHALLLQQQLVLLQVEQPLRLLGAPQVHEGAVQLHARAELRALALQAEVDAGGVVGQRGDVDVRLLLLLGPIQFFDELALAIIVLLVLQLELLLADLHLLLQRGGQVALKLYVAQQPGGRRVQDPQAVGGDVLLQQLHPLPDVVLQHCMDARVPFIFCCASRFSIRLVLSQRRRSLQAHGGGIILWCERAAFMGGNSLIKYQQTW